MKFETVLFIGPGFMAGCLAKDLKAKNLAKRTIALARCEERANEVRGAGVFDEVTADFKYAAEKADLIFICTPVGTIFRYICDLSEYLSPRGKTVYITDIGSTNGEIIKKVWGRVEGGDNWIRKHFVSSHPLCGAETAGAVNAKCGLYDNAPCIISGLGDENCENVIAKVWQSIGAKTTIMNAQEHDKILAYTSHLPHAISFAYLMGISDSYSELSAGSYKDMTRVGMSSYSVWRDIFISNKNEVSQALSTFISNLEDLKLYIERGDIKGIEEYIQSAQRRINGSSNRRSSR